MSTQFESVPRAVAETQYRAIWRVRGEDPPRDEVEAYLDYYEASILLGTAEEWTQERMESAQKRWKRLLLRRHGRKRGPARATSRPATPSDSRAIMAREFLRELGAAYDELVAEEVARQRGRTPRDIGMKLKDVRLRIQQKRGRRYPEESFVSDFYRLFASGELYLADGRRFWLYPSREVTTNIWFRVPPIGKEVQYGVIAFRKITSH